MAFAFESQKIAFKMIYKHFTLALRVALDASPRKEYLLEMKYTNNKSLVLSRTHQTPRHVSFLHNLYLSGMKHSLGDGAENSFSGLMIYGGKKGIINGDISIAEDKISVEKKYETPGEIKLCRSLKEV